MTVYSLPIVFERPPNYAAIRMAFPQCEAAKAFFAYGGKIYNPCRVPIGRELVAHEAVHCERQGNDPDTWWKRYIEEKPFRLIEELLAHTAEYRAWCENPGVTRNQRRVVLRIIAHRLASKLYGSLISVHDAKSAILDPDKPFRVRFDTPH